MHQEEITQKLADHIVHPHPKIPLKEGSDTQRVRRCLVALAGGPGSGKSTIAAQIADKVSKQHVKCQAVSIKGFMYPKSQLSKD